MTRNIARAVRANRTGDLHNKIGPSRHLLRCNRMSVVGGKAEIMLLRLNPEDATCVLDPHFVGDAGP
jgi:hypothetical protein